MTSQTTHTTSSGEVTGYLLLGGAVFVGLTHSLRTQVATAINADPALVTTSAVGALFIAGATMLLWGDD